MPSLADRVAALESLVADLAEAHDALDQQHELLFYKLQFVMDSVRVRRRNPAAILDANGEAPAIEGTITEFFARDGETYIAMLKVQADAIEKSIQSRQAVLGAVRDTLADTADSGAGRATGEAASDLRLVPTQA